MDNDWEGRTLDKNTGDLKLRLSPWLSLLLLLLMTTQCHC